MKPPIGCLQTADCVCDGRGIVPGRDHALPCPGPTQEEYERIVEHAAIRAMSELQSTIRIEHCARCNGVHEQVRFSRFLRPVNQYEYWALCPTTKEPILMELTFTSK